MLIAAWITIASLAASAPAPAPILPHCAAQWTDGRAFTLPDDARGRETMLVVAYTQKAKAETAAWSDAMRSRMGDRARVIVVAALDRVPRFARGMVRRSIAREVGPPGIGKPDFVTTFEGGALRGLAPEAADAVPLIVALGRDGAVVYARFLPYSPRALGDVAEALR